MKPIQNTTPPREYKCQDKVVRQRPYRKTAAAEQTDGRIGVPKLQMKAGGKFLRTPGGIRQRELWIQPAMDGKFSTSLG
jgi:hypothetical protein